MVIASKYEVKTYLLILFVLFLLLRIYSEIYFSRRASESRQITLHWLFTEYRTNCVYRWYQWQLKLPNCQDLVLGQQYLVIGRVTSTTDKGFFHPKKIDVLSIGPIIFLPNSVYSWLSSILTYCLHQRHFLLQKLGLIGLSPDQLVLLAILTGETTLLSASQRHFIEVTGMQHLFSVSGQHLSIILGAIRPVISRFWPKLVVFPLVGLAWLLAFLVSFQASMIRATIMTTLSLILPFVFHRKVSSWQLLLLTVVIMISVNPWYLFDIGFQLSLAAMTGVLVTQLVTGDAESWLMSTLTGNLTFVESSQQSLSWIQKATSTLTESFISTLVITLFTAPITLWHFQTASVAALVANPLIVWLIPLTMFTAFAFIGLSAASTYIQLPTIFMQLGLVVLELPISILMQLLELASRLEKLNLQATGTPELSHTLSYYLVLGAGFWCIRRKKRSYVLEV